MGPVRRIRCRLLPACGPRACLARGSASGCGLSVLDLGSGQGYFARELVRRGARVAGIDVAQDLVAPARAQEEREPLGIEYRVGSAARVRDEWGSGSLDLVTSCMALQDMADVPAVLLGAYEVLRPGGRLVFSVPHPVTDAPYREWERDAAGRKRCLKLDRYFETGPAGTAALG